MRITVVLLAIAIFSGLLTLLLHRIMVRWVKYIPALVSFIYAVFSLILVRNDSGEVMEDLARIILAILSFSFAAGGLIMALVLDLWQRRRNKASTKIE